MGCLLFFNVAGSVAVRAFGGLRIDVADSPQNHWGRQSTPLQVNRSQEPRNDDPVGRAGAELGTAQLQKRGGVGSACAESGNHNPTVSARDHNYPHLTRRISTIRRTTSMPLGEEYRTRGDQRPSRLTIRLIDCRNDAGLLGLSTSTIET